MKKISKISIAIMMIGCAIVIQFAFTQNTTGLTGTWVRNDEKSDADGLSINSIPIKLKISDTDGALTIVGTNKNGKGEISTYTDILKLDGSETKGQAGAETKLIAVKWSVDKKSLIVSKVYKNGAGEATRTISLEFSVSADGKTLTVKDERILDGETFKMTGIYNKQ